MSGKNRARTRHIQIVTPEEEMENLRNEVGVLRRAVESKKAAVGIFRTELQECQKERDKFRTIAEQGPLHRYSVAQPKKSMPYLKPSRSAMLGGSEGTLAQLLSQTKEENKSLRLEITELRCKLHDAQADLKVLRDESRRGNDSRRSSVAVLNTSSQLAHQEREQFISQMEELSAKSSALEGDVRGLVEEREELVRELDAASHKLHRLNHTLNILLSNNDAGHSRHRVIDLDAIITENRYLQQRLKQAEEEKTVAKSNASKYKAAVEKCRTQPAGLKLGTAESLIVTPKQVMELLQDYRGSELSGAAENDLKSLCVALVDSLNQRSRAIKTQRSANKVLVGRLTELERQLIVGNSPGAQENNHVGVSQMASSSLMEGYVPPSGPTAYNEEQVMQDSRLITILENKKSLVRNRSPSSDIKQNGCEENPVNEDLENVKSGSKDYSNSKKGDSLINEGQNSDTHCETLKNNKNSCDFQETKEKSPSNSTNSSLYLVSENLEKEVEFPSVSSTIKNDSNSSLKQVLVMESSSCDKNTIHLPPSIQKSHPVLPQAMANQVSGSSIYENPEDELEDIIPLDQLDYYMKDLQKQRKQPIVKTPEETDQDKTNITELQRQRKQLIGKTPEETDQDKTNIISDNKVTQIKAPPQIIHEENENQSSVSPSGSSTALLQNSTNNSSINLSSDRSPSNVSNSSEIKPNDKGNHSSSELKHVPSVSESDGEDSSFDLDLSDYDSDNDVLDMTIQSWQNDFNQDSQKGKKRSSSKKESQRPDSSSKPDPFKLWGSKSSSPPVSSELPQELKNLLDGASAQPNCDDLADRMDCA